MLEKRTRTLNGNDSIAIGEMASWTPLDDVSQFAAGFAITGGWVLAAT